MTSFEDIKVPACPKQQHVATKKGQISFCNTGQGPVVLFLHGLLGSSKAWAFQLASFSKSYFAVSWDAPGYGSSSLVNVDIDAYVQALSELIDALGEKRIVLVGHSMGGTVATRYAACHPEKVSQLVLSCTHPGYADEPTAPMSEKFEKRMLELQEIGPLAYGKNRAQDLLPFDGVPASVMAYAAEVAAQTNPEGLRRATRMLQLADNRAMLPQLKMPTLVLTGEKDKTVQPHLKADLLSLTPFTQHIEMPGLGHAPYFQAPEYYNQIIQDFLTQHGPN